MINKAQVIDYKHTRKRALLQEFQIDRNILENKSTGQQPASDYTTTISTERYKTLIEFAIIGLRRDLEQEMLPIFDRIKE